MASKTLSRSNTWRSAAFNSSIRGHLNMKKTSINASGTGRAQACAIDTVRNEVLGMRAEPAFTVVLAGLYEARGHIEIEAVAAA